MLYQPEDQDTDCWLVPGPENPAYKHPKIHFGWWTRVWQKGSQDDDRDRLLISFYVEKGVGPGAAFWFQETLFDRNHIMQEDWAWHRWLRAMGTDELDPLVAQMETRVGRPILVILRAGEILPNRQPAPLGWDVVAFDWSQGQLQVRREYLPAGHLRHLARVSTLAALDKVAQALKISQGLIPL